MPPIFLCTVSGTTSQQQKILMVKRIGANVLFDWAASWKFLFFITQFSSDKIDKVIS